MNSQIQARRGPLSALVFATFAVALFALGTGSAHATACAPPAFPGNGSFSNVNATKASCADAGKLILGFQACRTKLGPTARCVKKVNGFACQEIRTSGPASISANVKCARTKIKKVKKKKKKTKYLVTFSYTQNL